MSQALYRKWRPQNWDAVVGQPHVIQTLCNALAAGRIAHAYLFAGPRGTGKTTTARLLAKAVNCLEGDLALRPCGKCEPCQAVNQGRFLDLIEIDAASNTSVEDVRDLRDKINFTPNQGHYKVYIIDEVHMLSNAAFNALLKTLEEPPPHVIFILATTEVHKIPATVLSRCQRHEFRRIPVVEITACLRQMAESEGISVEPDALTLIARQSTGALRDAISLLDQLASTGKPITLALVQDVLGTAASQAVLDLVETLIQRKPDAGLDCLHAALDAGSDPRQLARQLVEYLRDLLLIRMGDKAQVEASAELRAHMAQHAQVYTPAELLRLIRVFNAAAVEARGAWHPSLPLEIALIEALEAPAGQPSAPIEPASAPPAASAPPKTEAGAGATPRPAPPSTAQREAQNSAASGARPAPQPASPVAPGPAPVDPMVAGSPAKSNSERSAAELSAADQQATRSLASSWPQILAEVRKANPNTSGLLNSVKSYFIKGDWVILGFASDVLKEKMQKPENLEVTQRVLLEIFQRPLTVRCHVVAARRSAVPPGVEEDGMVAAALRDLGGELVDMS
jgi:DNA polymerase-3 subunit gamma/tau